MSLSFVHPGSLVLLALVPLVIALALAGRRGPRRGRFWAGLGLRVLLMAMLVLALSGVQLRTRADTLTAVFVLDVSDSVPVEERARGEGAIRAAIESLPSGDRAAVVVFGQDALVERIASEEPLLPAITSAPVTARTDIAGALQLAMALFPDEGAKRLILLSDGRENIGAALQQAELAAAHGIELVYMPLQGPEGDFEVLIDALRAPADVRVGQRFELEAVVRATAPTGASLRVFADGRLVFSADTQLVSGANRFVVPIEADEAGFHRYRAEIVPDVDARLQNNQATAFTVVLGPPRILLVEGAPGEATQLAAALRAAEMTVRVVSPGVLPSELPELVGYDGVALVNVLADALPVEALDALEVYVRDLGYGLLMTGGEDAYGAGGYLRTPVERALPVDMDVRTKEESPNLALVLVVDKSGSMGRCHCDNPDLYQTYERREVGQPKVDIAKEAIMRAAAALGPRDYLGVVAFDESAWWALDVQQVVDVIALERSIGGMQAAGQTNMRAGVEAAYEALQDVEARFKHVILMTDGWIREGTVAEQAMAMRESGVTLSVVAAGGGSAEYLAELAGQGGGRYYPAVDVLRVPDFFLKETVRAVGEYIVEEPFYPLPAATSSVLSGLDVTRLPALLGYNGTTPKGTARVLLRTPRGDPLLATWQYGLGRSAAWTSDIKAQWATSWVTWDDFPRFASQVVAWTLPAPAVEGMQAEAMLADDGAVVRVELVDEDGGPRNYLDVRAALIGPDLARSEIRLDQVGAGQYEAAALLSAAGTYLVRVEAREGDQILGQETLGLVVPYSPEYRTTGTDRTLLGELARRTGGGELEELASVFLHDLPATDLAREVWRPLLLLVTLLFPLDIAVRRVMLGPRDLRKAWSWVRGRVETLRRPAMQRERVLGPLFAARDRARAWRSGPARQPQETEGSPAPRGEPVEHSEGAAEEGGMSQSEPAEQGTGAAPEQGDTLDRLREAKRRARQRK
ncbi:MAG: VWA domain-containing protein [Anaerolineae bacterium]|nr:VWA domain-containing protein [Anaerolineae bacterium]